MTDLDRIKLAEAMGWINTKGERVSPLGHRDPFDTWHRRGEDKVWDYLPFDPFTDANDDYAVLEWMRGQFGILNSKQGYVKEACDTFLEHLPHQYKIGDYARAALKVINDD